MNYPLMTNFTRKSSSAQALMTAVRAKWASKWSMKISARFCRWHRLKWQPPMTLWLCIPPRTDSTIMQQRAEELNSVLQETSTTLGAKFISNDTSFRLADGLPNDGYLSADGLHLNYRGTNRLAMNIGLKPAGQEVQIAKTRTTWNQGDRRSTRQNERSQCRQTDNEWHTVRRYHAHDRRNSTPTNAAPHSSSTPCCYFCGESGHVKQNCRHGRKLQCHTCQPFGHKSKFCQ